MHGLNGKTIAITGGTGSFGSTMLQRLLQTQIHQVLIISRDEEKQDRLRKSIVDERARFIVADIRDRQRMMSLFKNVDYVFHAAALKQVPTGEFFPEEMISTNVLGSKNVLDAASYAEVEKVICLSTDKAVYPINAMGISKAMMEKIAVSYARQDSQTQTNISVTRYGNVMCSRGSVIPRFLEQIYSGQPITITDPGMTRFLMSLDDAVELVLHSFDNASPGDVRIQKAPASSIIDLVLGIYLALGKNFDENIRNIGIRHGEKRHESLLTSEELASAVDHGRYFQVPVDSRGMRYEPYFQEGREVNLVTESFTSENAVQLDKEQVAELLLSNPEFLKLIGR